MEADIFCSTTWMRPRSASLGVIRQPALAGAVLAALLATLLASGNPLAAQDSGATEIDCSAPMTQIDMTLCAAQAYRLADAQLNTRYAQARDAARRMDVDLPAGAIPAAIQLRDAQRAWIVYRDLACEAESLIARGGSMQPQLRALCLERLTQQRSADLRLFVEVM